jgi:hypothetical protein
MRDFMKPISEKRVAVPKSTLIGKILALKEVRTGIKTEYGAQSVYTCTVGSSPELVDFFGGKGLDTQELKAGDVFQLKTMDTGKGNEMYYADSIDGSGKVSTPTRKK